MNDYSAWNVALCEYVTSGVPRGRPVFLHVDTAVLEAVGRTLPQPTAAGEAEGDFLRAVRAFVCPVDRVEAVRIRRIDPEHQVPLCLAFLAAMVLAATRMRDDDEAPEGNYFLRLGEVLGMPGEGRPRGMETGPEADVPLWGLWNRWLQRHGWLPTASAGEGAQVYVHYPISQALLREADTARLARIFQDRSWRQDLDPSALASTLERDGVRLSAHLRELLRRDGESREAVCEAIHELYEACRVSGGLRADDRGNGGARALRAGLIRSEDSWSGQTCYSFYPHTSRHLRAADLVVAFPSGQERLRHERAGRYDPVGEVSPEILASGVRYPVHGAGEPVELVLPRRRFWILVPDPEDPGNGTYGTWGGPVVGDPYVLLLDEALLPEVYMLRDEGLFRWAEPARELGGGWYELRRCEPVTESWSEVFVEDRELKEALQPAASIGLRLSGGLRAPGRRGWIDGAGPAVEVSGYAPEVELLVVAVESDVEQTILQVPVETGGRRQVPWPGPGDYRVEASVAGQRVRQVVNIVGWDMLRRSVPAAPVATELPGVRVIGARAERATAPECGR